jgi:hypothetical protein
MAVQWALNQGHRLHFLQTRLWLGFQAHIGSVSVASSVRSADVELSQFARFTDEEAAYRN